jgi:hypothetical protein
VEVPQDAIADPHDGWRLAIDEESERLAVPGQDGRHDAASLVIERDRRELGAVDCAERLLVDRSGSVAVIERRRPIGRPVSSR